MYGMWEDTPIITIYSKHLDIYLFFTPIVYHLFLFDLQILVFRKTKASIYGIEYILHYFISKLVLKALEKMYILN